MNRLDCLGALSAAMLTLLASGTANAEFNYFEQNGYDAPLERCLDLLRPALAAEEGDKISWRIDAIDLRGPSYHFEIAASLTDPSGELKLDGFRVGCVSNRWIADARLEERPNQGPLPQGYEVLALN